MIILPLGVSIRGGNLYSPAREAERLESFLHELGSESKIERERRRRRRRTIF